MINKKKYVEVKAVNGRGVLDTDIFNYKLETEDGDKSIIEIINDILQDLSALKLENEYLRKIVDEYQLKEDKTDNLIVSSLDLLQKKVARLEVTAILATVLSFLTANLGTIIVFAIKYIKLKVKEAKQKAENDEIIQKLTAEYEAKIEGFASRIDKSLDKVEAVVIKKVKERDDAQNAIIEEETIRIAEAIEETKKALLN